MLRICKSWILSRLTTMEPGALTGPVVFLGKTIQEKHYNQFISNLIPFSPQINLKMIPSFIFVQVGEPPGVSTCHQPALNWSHPVSITPAIRITITTTIHSYFTTNLFFLGEMVK